MQRVGSSCSGSQTGLDGTGITTNCSDTGDTNKQAKGWIKLEEKKETKRNPSKKKKSCKCGEVFLIKRGLRLFRPHHVVATYLAYQILQSLQHSAALWLFWIKCHIWQIWNITGQPYHCHMAIRPCQIWYFGSCPNKFFCQAFSAFNSLTFGEP